MSRTIRRTRGDVQALTSYRPVTEDVATFVRIFPCDPAYAQEYWAYHGEERSGMWGVPRWYRKQCTQQFKKKETRRLHQALRRDEMDVVDIPRKQNAGYTWW